MGQGGDQLDQLTLNSAQLLEKQRSALDESNRALFDQIQAATRIPLLHIADATAEKIAALDAGADDYVTKPFSLEELVARGPGREDDLAALGVHHVAQEPPLAVERELLE